jgi:predicted permease
MLNDLRHAVRLMGRQRAFTAIALLTLALGIGTNAAMFALVNALLYRPLPAHEPERLRFIYLTDPDVPGYQSAIRYEDYLDLRERRDVFVDVLARAADEAQITASHDIRNTRGERVTGHYFEVLGVSPAIGRTLTAADDHPGSEPVAVISTLMWQSRFSADPGVLGRTVRLENRAYTIVGVMPERFRGTLGTWELTQYWVPMQQRAADLQCRYPQPLSQWAVTVVGRLQPGVTPDKAQAALSGIRLPFSGLPAGAQPRDRLWSPELFEAGRSRLPFDTFGRIVPEKFAVALMALATIVLLIAAANLGGMLAARGVTRQGEMATRMALGAGRWRVARQLLCESLILALVGGTFGLLLAGWGLAGFVAAVPTQFARFDLAASEAAQVLVIDAPVDVEVVLYTLAVCLVAGVLVGIVPALQAGRTGVLGSLTTAALATPRRARRQLRHWIVVPQVCLSLGLLLVAGILVRSLTRMELVDHGYDPAPLVSINFDPPRILPCDRRQPSAAEIEAARLTRGQAYRRMLEAGAAIAGVTSISLSHALPIEMPRAGGTWISARDADGKLAQSIYISRVDVTPQFFQTMEIPLLHGRTFSETDGPNEARVAIVSERIARALWAGRNALGQHVAFQEAASAYPPRWFEVIGVVKDVDSPLNGGGYARPAAYIPLGPGSWVRSLVARGSEPAPQMIRDLKLMIARVLPGEIAAYLYSRRIAAGILGAAGLVGLLLASVGIYGVVSYSVAQRTREFGLRRALGADGRDILGLILREGARVASLGSALGLLAGYAAVRLTSSRLVALPSLDVTTLIVAPALIVVVVLMACYLPARRAARVDPMVALRDL